MTKTIILLLSMLQLGFLGSPTTWGQGQTIFQIGKKDQSYAEFVLRPDSNGPVIYRVGQSLPARDWPAYQPGSLDDFPKNPKGVPYKVQFFLKSTPKGTFILRLDAIFRYREPATPHYVVEINGRLGSYRLNPHPAPELWWPTGGIDYLQFIGYLSSDMVLPASYFRRGDNTLTVRCVDGFGIYYDDLSLTNEPDSKVPRITEASLQPTVFYKNRSSGLVELARLTVRTSRALHRATLKADIGTTEIKREINQEKFGDLEALIEVPATTKSLPASLYLSGTRHPILQTTFQPQRRWRVYAEPREQADFGYDEVPAVTLEWENQYTDRFLDILQQYPGYSFTLDASANLQSYLKTRDEAHEKRLLDYLRSGKVGMNGLWMNFFTGLSTPEELFQVENYALRAGKKYGFIVDEASQTDEPSVTWALPQIMAEAGIKYFANGSDPIHGPFNPIGHLNFHSPYYWEAANGSKVLVWDAVNYTVIRDLTWNGWDPKDVSTDAYDASRVGCWVVCEELPSAKYSPSLFGLQHSLPLFLSQYDRKDYPFDGVLLYGLENDEIPISHFGSADIFKHWNEEYEYPKIISGTLRDYFGYITSHFGSEINTYRGDGGAYWEDESGADARISAMNRSSQMQITAAEKLASIVTWIQPHVKYDETPFREAWDNIMLTDSYVWSGQGSTQPDSYLTKTSEDGHRGYAEDAFRQTRAQLAIAMDQIGQSIKTTKRGVVVFNTGSQSRNGLFDWDLQVNETPQDPATGQPLPCVLLDSSEGYWKIRCWATDVPAMGYKFYPIVTGRVLLVRAETVATPGIVIEGRYYKLQLDPASGAVAQLIDKETGQNLVALDSGYKLNQYLYVTGGDLVGKSRTYGPLYNSDPTLKLPDLTIHKQTLIGRPTVAHLPWGSQVTIRTHAVNTPEIITTITLNDEQKEVIFRNDVEKTSTLKKEGVYFAFPFNVKQPQVDYQGATTWVNPEVDMLPGAGRQSFVTQGGVLVKGINQSIGWVSVDAPLITFGDINRGTWPEATKIRNGSIFSYVMNNYWEVDTPAQQGGHFTFRYVLTSGTDVPLSTLGRMTAQARTPLYASRHSHKNWEQMLPEKDASFLGVTPDGVAVLTIRPTADTYLIRVQNRTNHALTADLQFPLVQLEDAGLGSVLGDKLEPVKWSRHDIRFNMKRYDITTIVIRIKDGSTRLPSIFQRQEQTSAGN